MATIPVYKSRQVLSGKSSSPRSLQGEMATPRRVVDTSQYVDASINAVSRMQYQGTGEPAPNQPLNADLALERASTDMEYAQKAHDLGIQSTQSRNDYSETVNRINLFNQAIQGAVKITDIVYKSRQEELIHNATKTLAEEFDAFNKEIETDPKYRDLTVSEMQDMWNERSKGILTQATQNISDDKTRRLVESKWFAYHSKGGTATRAFARVNQLDRTDAAMFESNKAEWNAYSEDYDPAHLKNIKSNTQQYFMENNLKKSDMLKALSAVDRQAALVRYTSPDPTREQENIAKVFVTEADFVKGGIFHGKKPEGELQIGQLKPFRYLPSDIQDDDVDPDTRKKILNHMVQVNNKLKTEANNALKYERYMFNKEIEYSVLKAQLHGVDNSRDLERKAEALYGHDPETLEIVKDKIKSIPVGVRIHYGQKDLDIKSLSDGAEILKNEKANLKTSQDPADMIVYKAKVEHFKNKLKMMDDDKAGFAIDVLKADPNNPQEIYLKLKAQGVSDLDMEIVRKTDAGNIIQTLNAEKDPQKRDDIIRGLQQKYGDLFPMAIRDLSRNGLKADIGFTASIDHPKDEELRLMSNNTMDMKLAEIQKGLPVDVKPLDIKEAVTDALEDYKLTLLEKGVNFNESNKKFIQIKDNVEKLVSAYVSKGMSVDIAIGKVMKGLFVDRYESMDGYNIPKYVRIGNEFVNIDTNAVDQYGKRLVKSINSSDIKLPENSDPNLTQKDFVKEFMTKFKKGYSFRNTEIGLQLYDHRGLPVFNEQGNPYIIKYTDMPHMKVDPNFTPLPDENYKNSDWYKNMSQEIDEDNKYKGETKQDKELRKELRSIGIRTGMIKKPKPKDDEPIVKDELIPSHRVSKPASIPKKVIKKPVKSEPKSSHKTVKPKVSIQKQYKTDIVSKVKGAKTLDELRKILKDVDMDNLPLDVLNFINNHSRKLEKNKG